MDQGRITNIQDVAGLAPYFFVDPDYSTPEAQFMNKSLLNDNYRACPTNLPSPSTELTIRIHYFTFFTQVAF